MTKWLRHQSPFGWGGGWEVGGGYCWKRCFICQGNYRSWLGNVQFAKKKRLNTYFVPACCRSRNLNATLDQTMPFSTPYGFKLRLELGPAIYIRNKNGLNCIDRIFWLLSFCGWYIVTHKLMLESNTGTSWITQSPFEQLGFSGFAVTLNWKFAFHLFIIGSFKLPPFRTSFRFAMKGFNASVCPIPGKWWWWSHLRIFCNFLTNEKTCSLFRCYATAAAQARVTTSQQTVLC